MTPGTSPRVTIGRRSETSSRPGAGSDRRIRAGAPRSGIDATETDRTAPLLAPRVTPTVDDLRNEIRREVGRFERVESTGFTKETLAAICEAVGYDVDTDRLPPTSEMRTGILRAIDAIDDRDSESLDRPLRKAELEAIAAALREE
jgi:hypothetical protein